MPFTSIVKVYLLIFAFSLSVLSTQASFVSFTYYSYSSSLNIIIIFPLLGRTFVVTAPLRYRVALLMFLIILGGVIVFRFKFYNYKFAEQFCRDVVRAGGLYLEGFQDSRCEYYYVGFLTYFTSNFFDSRDLFVNLVEGYLRFARAIEINLEVSFSGFTNFVKVRSFYY